MALTVETGAGISGADSYISLVDARAIAADYGYTLPTDDTEAEVALRRGTIYVDSKTYSGSAQYEGDDYLEWPRTGATCNSDDVPEDYIPNGVKLAEVIAAEAYGNGVNVRGYDDGREVSKEKLDTLEVGYFQNGNSGSSVEITEADDAVSCLINKAAGNEYQFGVFRA